MSSSVRDPLVKSPTASSILQCPSLHLVFKKMAQIDPTNIVFQSLLKLSSGIPSGEKGDTKRLEMFVDVLYVNLGLLSINTSKETEESIEDCRCMYTEVNKDKLEDPRTVCVLHVLNVFLGCAGNEYLQDGLKRNDGKQLEWIMKICWKIHVLRNVLGKCKTFYSLKLASKIFADKTVPAISPHELSPKNLDWEVFVMPSLGSRLILPDIAVQVFFEILVGFLRMPRGHSTDMFAKTIVNFTMIPILFSLSNFSANSAQVALEFINILLLDSKVNAEVIFRCKKWQIWFIPFIVAEDAASLKHRKIAQAVINPLVESMIFRCAMNIFTSINFHVMKSKSIEFRLLMRETRNILYDLYGWNEETTAIFRLILFSILKKLKSDIKSFSLDYESFVWHNLLDLFELIETFLFYQPINIPDKRHASILDAKKTIGLHIYEDGVMQDMLIILEVLDLLDKKIELNQFNPHINAQIAQNKNIINLGKDLEREKLFFRNVHHFFCCLEQVFYGNDTLKAISDLLTKRNGKSFISNFSKQSYIEQQLRIEVDQQQALLLANSKTKGNLIAVNIEKKSVADLSKRGFSSASAAQKFFREKRRSRMENAVIAKGHLHSRHNTLAFSSAEGNKQREFNQKSAQSSIARNGFNGDGSLLNQRYRIKMNIWEFMAGRLDLSRYLDKVQTLLDGSELEEPFDADIYELLDIDEKEEYDSESYEDSTQVEPSYSQISHNRVREASHTYSEIKKNLIPNFAKVIRACTSSSKDELTSNVGDLVEVLDSKSNPLKWLVVLNGKLGHISSACLQSLNSEDSVDYKKEIEALLAQQADQNSVVIKENDNEEDKKEEKLSESKDDSDLEPLLLEHSSTSKSIILEKGTQKLRCEYCGIDLLPTEVYELDGLMCCANELTKKALSCSVCSLPVTGRFYTLATGETRHEECMTCSVCSAKLEDPSSFRERDGALWCMDHYLENYGSRCPRCDKVIHGQYIYAMGKQWHPEHFICSGSCKKSLTGEYFIYEDQVLCKKEYEERFAKKCIICSKSIFGSAFKVGESTYHSACVACKFCGISYDGSSPFYIDGVNSFLCETHHAEKNLKKCSSCEKYISIQEDCASFLGSFYHVTCLTCATCGEFPSDNNLVQKDGKFYCRKDYKKLFAEKCWLCDTEITKAAVKLGEMKCHSECIKCSVCKKSLLGEQGKSTEVFQSKKTLKSLLCRDHFLAENAKTCSSCQTPILDGNLLNVKEKSFHLDCFSCKVCKKNVKDEKFAFVNGELRCRLHIFSS